MAKKALGRPRGSQNTKPPVGPLPVHNSQLKGLNPLQKKQARATRAAAEKKFDKTKAGLVQDAAQKAAERKAKAETRFDKTKAGTSQDVAQKAKRTWGDTPCVATAIAECLRIPVELCLSIFGEEEYIEDALVLLSRELPVSFGPAEDWTVSGLVLGLVVEDVGHAAILREGAYASWGQTWHPFGVVEEAWYAELCLRITQWVTSSCGPIGTSGIIQIRQARSST